MQNKNGQLLLSLFTTWFSLEQWFPNLTLHQNHLDGSLKYRLPSSILRVSDLGGGDQAQEFAFSTSSQVMGTLLVLGPPWESLPECVEGKGVPIGSGEDI